MSKKQYLTEEKYQATKNKIIKIAMTVLIIGLLVGGGLITTGLIKYSQTKLSTEEINNIQSEIDSHNAQLSSLKEQRNQEFFSNHFSEKYYNIDNEINKLEDKIDALEDKLEPDTSYLVVYYMFGGFIIAVTLMVSWSIYTTAKGREINAFLVQQQMPIAQEGIEKMAPTVGKAAGNIGKELAKGIKEGIKEEDEK